MLSVEYRVQSRPFWFPTPISFFRRSKLAYSFWIPEANWNGCCGVTGEEQIEGNILSLIVDWIKRTIFRPFSQRLKVTGKFSQVFVLEHTV